MKYLKLYESYEDKMEDINNIFQEIKDIGYGFTFYHSVPFILIYNPLRDSNGDNDHLLDYLHKQKEIPQDILTDKIIKGKITTMLELKNEISKFHKKFNTGIELNPFSHNESRISNWIKFINENILVIK